MAEYGPIDFGELAEALLQRAHLLVPEWLPDGVQRGHEYVCGGLGGGKGTSCSVNLTTGRWADFAGDESGGDLTSLYAAIHNLNNGQAAVQLMAMLGWQRSPAVPSSPSGSQAPAQGLAQAADDRPAPPVDDERAAALQVTSTSG